ncbi:MAG: 16S rRNA (guanine(527)-N(7))-methyltransferase RsmG, partial [Acidimicrobiales bacterium]
MEVPEALRAPLAALFGERSAKAQCYAHLLSTIGVSRGLLGPSEAPRIWERHILNCGAIAPHVSTVQHLVDVGSGAGLPGIVLAIAHQDLRACFET